MFKNYFISSLRNIKKHKGYAFINIFGLAVGLTGCILIFLYVTDELSFDNFHAKEKSIYRVMCSFLKEDGSVDQRGPSMPAAAAPLIKDYFPEIRHSVRFARERGTVRAGDRLYNETVTFTDPAVFEVFSFPLLKGDPGTVLARDDDLVLTESTAAKYFGRKDPVRETITITFGTNRKDFVVAGVAADTPRNSSIQFQFLILVDNLTVSGYKEALTNLGDFSYPLYVQLEDGIAPEQIESRLDSFLGQAFAAEFARWGVDVQKRGHYPIALDLQGLRDMHFDTTSRDGADPANVLILAGIALIVLVIACINFVNLSIGRAAVRATEIGMRKVIGAGRRQILHQFLSESLILVGGAFLGGIGLAAIFMPIFNRFSGKIMAFSDFLRPANIFGLGVLLLIVAAAAGSYPALVMSGIPPIQAFKGKMGMGGRQTLTKILVIVQFGLSIFLIVSTLVLGRQIRYMTEKDPGYIREGLLSVRVQAWRAEESQPIVDRFRNRVRTVPGVANVSAANVSLGRGSSSFPLKKDGAVINVYQFRVDPEYIPTMGIRLAQGRNFSPARASDTGAAIVNKEFCRKLGIPDPVGHRIGEFIEGKNTEYPFFLEIIGVMEDYNVLSLKNSLQPVLLQMQPKWGMSNMLVRIQTAGVARTMKELESAWREVQPDKPFEYTFLEDDLESQYAAETKWNGIIRCSTIFAIIIACMGIFGLTSLAVNRRFKEIGIRKVLGAGVGQIFSLVTGEFVLLVAAANLAAWPAVYYVMRRILNNYYYRISLKPSFFLAAGALSLLVALLTVSYLALRAALSDPVKAIRYE
jgi:putative ABC transport system permease protein